MIEKLITSILQLVGEINGVLDTKSHAFLHLSFATD
jgi:hypothetical protein